MLIPNIILVFSYPYHYQYTAIVHKKSSCTNDATTNKCPTGFGVLTKQRTGFYTVSVVSSFPNLFNDATIFSA